MKPSKRSRKRYDSAAVGADSSKTLSVGRSSDLERLPLDLAFVILRLLPIRDALSLCATCKPLYAISHYRSFWVYANLDADAMGRRPGPLDYSKLSLSALKNRIAKSHRIFRLWRSEYVNPQRTRVLPVNAKILRVVAIPWTTLLVTAEATSVVLHNWATKLTRVVPVVWNDSMRIFDIRIFWIQSIRRNVLVVGLSNRYHDPPHRTELQLFVVDVDEPSAVYLTTAKFPYWISTFVLAEARLAVVGHTHTWTYFIHAMDVCYIPIGPPVTIAIASLGRHWPVPASSFTIMDDSHYLFAGPHGVAVYKLSQTNFKANESIPIHVRPCWQHEYSEYEVVYRPILGHVFFDPVKRHRTVSLCSGAYLRRVIMMPNDEFRLTESVLVEGIPLNWGGLAAGLHVGVYHRPLGSPAFRTFRMTDNAVDVHPFTSTLSVNRSDGGSVSHRIKGVPVPGTLLMDEGEGRIMFMLRISSRRASIVVLEFVL
ncbi:hypothetical protein B0H16DRAFT_1495573 [Mycena metata]|uniref:F-box domain-containing protein n=1 Tax=Mycena metata TaxID=1033252 RepID=A0AAD7P0V7_9AGAR|nr:hypothetical protein B0H16DRAFT_1495573 [Mycena metata]